MVRNQGFRSMEIDVDAAVKIGRESTSNVFFWQGKWKYKWRDRPDARWQMSTGYDDKIRARRACAEDRLRSALQVAFPGDQGRVEGAVLIFKTRGTQEWSDFFRKAVREIVKKQRLTGIGDAITDAIDEHFKGRRLSGASPVPLPDR